MRPSLRFIVPMILGALLWEFVGSMRQPARAAVDLTQHDVLAYLSRSGTEELAQLTEKLEARWGVRAAATAVAVGPRADSPAPAPPPAPTEFDVFLLGAGQRKIDVIKAVRVVLPVGLKEAKDLVERAPTVVLKRRIRSEADAAAKILLDAGAEVEVRASPQ